jgi:predicted dehydrogenase
MIGLDTSHTVEFTRLMQAPDCPAEKHVGGMRAVTCLRFETPFQNAEGLNARQAQMEAWGVAVTEDFDTAVADCDAIMLEINDPAYHLEYFTRVAALGKPVFLDKPLAATLAEGQAIRDLAQRHGTRVMSCSNLRFAYAFVEALAAAPNPLRLYAHGVLGAAPAGDSLTWYGVHAFEMIHRTFGVEGARVTACETATGVVSVIDYPGNRKAIAELDRERFGFDGYVRGTEQCAGFIVDLGLVYTGLLQQVLPFFRGGDPAATLDDAVGVMALMDATNRALAAGRTVEV